MLSKSKKDVDDKGYHNKSFEQSIYLFIFWFLGGNDEMKEALSLRSSKSLKFQQQWTAFGVKRGTLIRKFNRERWSYCCNWNCEWGGGGGRGRGESVGKSEMKPYKQIGNEKRGKGGVIISEEKNERLNNTAKYEKAKLKRGIIAI